LGSSISVSNAVPVAVEGIDNIVAIDVAGGNTDAASCALQTTGKLFCWGSNSLGQLGIGQVSSSGISFALTPTLAINVASAQAMSKGFTFGCAIVGTERRVVCWGRNQLFELGSDAAGSDSDAPLDVRINGSLIVATSITSGTNHSCALALGEVICWGANGNGQLGLPINTVKSLPVRVSGFTTLAKALSLGLNHSCALLIDGKVACWGDNFQGMLGNGSQQRSLEPINVPGISDAVAISANVNNTCALRATGAVLCWGDGEDGQLGNGQFVDSLVPVTVQGLQDAVAITTGESHTCAIRANKTAVCWGKAGFLGSNTTTNSAVPVEVTGGAIFGK
jgi:Regulator of chromosome condensation (RCC1) repeat